MAHSTALKLIHPKEATVTSATIILTHPCLINLAILSTFFTIEHCESCLTCCPSAIGIAVLTIATETCSQVTVFTLSKLLIIVLLADCLI
jgi:hypothetical protein